MLSLKSPLWLLELPKTSRNNRGSTSNLLCFVCLGIPVVKYFETFLVASLSYKRSLFVDIFISLSLEFLTERGGFEERLIMTHAIFSCHLHCLLI